MGLIPLAFKRMDLKKNYRSLSQRTITEYYQFKLITNDLRMKGLTYVRLTQLYGQSISPLPEETRH
jgi:hypothetical protein